MTTSSSKEMEENIVVPTKYFNILRTSLNLEVKLCPKYEIKLIFKTLELDVEETLDFLCNDV